MCAVCVAGLGLGLCVRDAASCMASLALQLCMRRGPASDYVPLTAVMSVANAAGYVIIPDPLHCRRRKQLFCLQPSEYRVSQGGVAVGDYLHAHCTVLTVG